MEKFSIESNKDSMVNPYYEWQKKMAKSGNYDIGELQYIKYAIEEGNEIDLNKALEFTTAYYKNREDLLADIYIKTNRPDEAMDLIAGVNRSDNYGIMSESLDNFIEQFPDQKSFILEKIKKSNPDFYKYIPKDILE